VIVDLWATWCGPCIASIPHNNELSEKYKNRGVVLIGVCTSQNGQDKFDDVVKDKEIKYPAATDPKLETEKAWRVMWYPTYAVVDKKGILRAIGLQPPYVEKVVDKLLAEDAPKASAKVHPVMYAMAADADKGAEWRERDLHEMEGKAPPELSVQNWINGSGMKLADLKGKVVVLDFWATWCGPCIASIPHTNEMLAKYKDKGLVVIGVCHTEGADKMADTAKEKGIQYPIAADIEGKTVKAFNVDSFPDYYIIDRSGKLRIADCNNDKVEEAVEALLAESAPTADAK
jgi:thiol-disulfide isomerase/thioredoxin